MEQLAPKNLKKKPYSSPQLRFYGDIGEITRTVGNVGPNADGGTGLTNKTG